MDSLGYDLRFAMRSLLARPGFSILAAGTLAIGIGSTTTLFSVVDALVLQPPPFQRPESLVEIWRDFPNRGFSMPHQSVQALEVWRANDDLFASVEAYQSAAMTLNGLGDPEVVSVGIITPGMLNLLGVLPEEGRRFGSEERREDRVALVAASIWNSKFPDDRALGTAEMMLDGEAYRVVGVLPDWFNFPYGETAYWIPVQADLSRTSLILTGRLADGVSLASARERIKTLAAGLDETTPRRGGWASRLRAVSTLGVSNSVRESVTILFWAVTGVLLIACVNVANLLLSQFGGRRRDTALRAALGAGRWRIVRQLFVESLLLSLAGAALGLVLAGWLLSVVHLILPPEINFWSFRVIGLDWRVWFFCLGASGVSAVLFGLLPALQASRSDLVQDLKERARSLSAGNSRLARTLVTAEVALTVVLLAGASLLSLSFWNRIQQDIGFEPDELTIVSISLSEHRYGDEARRAAFFDEVTSQIEALAGIDGVTVATQAPTKAGQTRFGFGSIEVAGRPADPSEVDIVLPTSQVRSDYFTTVGIDILAGSTFSSDDPTDVIINRQMAQQLFGDASPIGQRIRFGEKDPWRTVVGVAGDVLLPNNHGGLHAYEPLPAARGLRQTLIVKTPLSESIANRIREAVWSVDPLQPLDIQSGANAVGTRHAEPRFYLILMAGFAAAAMVLSLVGLYGTIAANLAQRGQEMGVRVALGARENDIFGLVFRHGMAPTLIGLVLGLAGAAAFAQVLSSLLFGIEPLHPGALAATAALLLTAAATACAVPAWRATRINPVQALRAD